MKLLRKRNSKPLRCSYELEVEDRIVPVFVTLEYRRDARVSIGKTGVHLRLSRWMSTSERKAHTARFLDWARDRIKAKGLPGHTPSRQYEDGEILLIGGKRYALDIRFADRKTIGGHIERGIMHVVLPHTLEEDVVQTEIGNMVARLAAKQFGPDVEARVREFNRLFFGRRLGEVRMKNNRSNWGSCSPKRNINLSTRLLLVPPKVMDYVIVHELAHLVHLNHSRAFWREVERAMPDYKKWDRWLKTHGDSYRF